MNTTTQLRDNLDADLIAFTGTESYHPHYIRYPGHDRPYYYTDGLHFMGEKFGAFWLIDVAASHAMSIQVNKKIDDADKEFLSGKLTVNDNHTALFVMENGNGKTLTSQRIPYTDFPARAQSLWVVDGVIMLPSEY